MVLGGEPLHAFRIELILAVGNQVLYLVQQRIGKELRIGKVERIVARKAPQPYIFAAGATPTF